MTNFKKDAIREFFLTHQFSYLIEYFEEEEWQMYDSIFFDIT